MHYIRYKKFPQEFNKSPEDISMNNWKYPNFPVSLILFCKILSKKITSKTYPQTKGVRVKWILGRLWEALSGKISGHRVYNFKIQWFLFSYQNINTLDISNESGISTFATKNWDLIRQTTEMKGFFRYVAKFSRSKYLAICFLRNKLMSTVSNKWNGSHFGSDPK